MSTSSSNKLPPVIGAINSPAKPEELATKPTIAPGIGGHNTNTKTATPLNYKMSQLFKMMVDQNASDLHLVVGSPPALRISGNVSRIQLPDLTAENAETLIMQVLTDPQKLELKQKRQLDFSVSVKGLARFRCNVFYQQAHLSAVFRTIPTVIPDFASLGLPRVLLDMCAVSNGLILVTGPTGSGKSTTLASMIDQLNQKEYAHIITLEDPIEFVHMHKNSIVNQREVGTDVTSFSAGLKSLLRQNAVS